MTQYKEPINPIIDIKGSTGNPISNMPALIISKTLKKMSPVPKLNKRSDRIELIINIKRYEVKKAGNRFPSAR
ncbi:MAG TPA: hypothetical protein PK443_00090 [bacterium]|nr:hypothetical protein [bacterium]